MARTRVGIFSVGSDHICAGHRLVITTALPSLIKTADFAITYVKNTDYTIT
ncbi:hypothetical protein RQN30_12090 [Arcanobacterium hippocoleae]